MNRLLPFLSASGRATILKCYPLEKYPDVWSALNWNCFPTDQQLTFQRHFTNITASTPSNSNTMSRGSLFIQTSLKNLRRIVVTINNYIDCINYITRIE